jgi:predicted permease
MLQDFRFGLRTLLKYPAFTAIAVGSLALGIGATTAMYSVIHAVILDPFPYQDVDSLASILVTEADQRGRRTSYTVDQYLEFAERATIFDGVIASTISDVTWTGEGEPQRLRGNHCSMDTFRVMGVPPLYGRVLTASDAAPNAEPVAILGYRFWQRQFGGDSGVVGRRLTLNGVVRTVIGVMPQRFMWRGADVYVPVNFRRGEAVEGVRYVHVLGRVKPGVTAAQAEADLRPIVAELQRRSPSDFGEKWRVGLLSFKETFPSGIREALWILFGAVGLLLLIACANVSNLLLARATARQREIAVRASLGAGRLRIIRQLLAESLTLAATGGVAGVALAYACLRGIIAVTPPGTIPDESKIAINTPVLLFTLAVCALAALLFGLAPALHLAGGDTATALKEAGRSAAGSLRQRWLRGALVAGEVALCLMLLVGAGLMFRTLLALENTDLGIRPDQVLTLRIPLSERRYPDVARRNDFLRDVLRDVEATPGVLAAGLNSELHPLGAWPLPVEIPGRPGDTRPVLFHRTSENYIRAIGIRLLQGRLLSERDMTSKAQVALVNRAFVARYFPGTNPLGQVVRVPRFRHPPASLPDYSFEIAGVIEDTVNRIATGEKLPEMHIPYTLFGVANRLVVATKGPPHAVANSVRARVYELDREQPVMDVKTIEELLRDFVYARPRFNLLLFSLFAGMGLALALFGVYGVTSHAVAQRTQEIGIRMALGASLAQITALVLRTGVRVIGAGIAVGLAASAASARLLSNLVTRMPPLDPWSFAVAAVALVACGLFACWWPARRAARVDPANVLRHE